MQVENPGIQGIVMDFHVNSMLKLELLPIFLMLTPLITNLLCVINSALNQPLFFTIANHKLKVVEADASFLKS